MFNSLAFMGTIWLNEQNEAPVIIETTANVEASGLSYGQISAFYARAGDSSMQTFVPSADQWKDKGYGMYTLVFPNTIINQEGLFLYRVTALATGYNTFHGSGRIEKRPEDAILDEPKASHVAAGSVAESWAPSQYDVRTSIAYNDESLSLTMLVSLHKNGQTVLTPTSCRVRLKKNGGSTAVVDASSVTPNAEGVFVITQSSIALDADSVYEMISEVVSSGSTYMTVDGGVTFN